VIAIEPDLGQIIKMAVGCDLGNRQVAMIIQNRHVPGEFVVEHFGSFRLQQEIFRQKRLHDELLSESVKNPAALKKSGQGILFLYYMKKPFTIIFVWHGGQQNQY